jgi:hypothetical protein
MCDPMLQHSATNTPCRGDIIICVQGDFSILSTRLDMRYDIANRKRSIVPHAIQPLAAGRLRREIAAL